MVVEVVWEDSPASVLKVVSVALAFVVVTPALVVTEVSVLKDNLSFLLYVLLPLCTPFSQGGTCR